jgi:hypothetical protein
MGDLSRFLTGTEAGARAARGAGVADETKVAGEAKVADETKVAKGPARGGAAGAGERLGL